MARGGEKYGDREDELGERGKETEKFRETLRGTQENWREDGERKKKREIAIEMRRVGG